MKMMRLAYFTGRSYQKPVNKLMRPRCRPKHLAGAKPVGKPVGKPSLWASLACGHA